jgi:drug/metabolite transporter (DMT)-like permease
MVAAYSVSSNLRAINVQQCGTQVDIHRGVQTSRKLPLALLAVYLIWGSTYLAMRIAVHGIPPFLMAGGRFLITGAMLLAFAKFRGSPWPSARQWMNAMPVGVLMFVCGNGTVAFAEKSMSSGVAAIVCGTMPLCMSAMGLFLGERTTKRELIALCIGLLGVAVLSLGDELKSNALATALIFVAPLAWAAGSLLAKRLPLAPGLMSSATQMLTGGLVMTILSRLAKEEIPAHPPAESVWAWIYLGLFGSLVAYTAYMWLLSNARPALATSYSFVNPVIAVLFGYFLGHEPIGWETLASVVLVAIATVLLVTQPTRGQRPA